ncbi:NADP-dependent oxidoreductase domain-containing protein, partial [Dimargaris cristalligena]
DPAVKEVAEETGHTPAQVLLAWGLQNGTSVIPKSANPDRIKSNFECQFELTDTQYQKLPKLSATVRFGEPHEMWGILEGSLFDE